MPAEGRHLLLYDGVCGLCDRLVQFVLAHDRTRAFHFASLQSEAARTALAPQGVDAATLTTFYVVANYRTAPRLLAKGEAALFVAGVLGWPWKAIAALRLLPAAVLNGVYDLVARYRYRLFGQYDQCLLPRVEYRNRFIGP
jgi:predicted DCC family thiol-disulfide oxidoreductase YuxK